MERSRARALAHASVLLGGAALLAVVLATVRLLPAPDLAAGGVGWIPAALLAALAAASAATSLLFLVAGLRRGSLAALLGGGAAATIAGGSVSQLAGADAFTSALPVAALLLGAAAAAERTRTLVGGEAARIAVAVAALAVAQGGSLMGVVPATADVLQPIATQLLGAAVAIAALGPLIARRLVPPGILGAIGAAAVLLDRSGLELTIGLAALLGAQLAALVIALDALEREPADGDDARLPPLADYLADAVLHFDGRLQLVDWNGPAASLLGLDQLARGARLEDLLGVSIAQIPPDDGAAVASGVAGLEIALHRSGGGLTAVIRDGRMDEDADRLARELRGTLEELLRARRTIELQREELDRSATVDLLTGVASRGAIIERLQVEIAQARRYQHPVAVVALDVDEFASINRRHGVAGGDALLREVALRLRLRVREADALGRAGSDGFLAVLPHTDEEGAATFAGALRHRISQRPILLDEELVSVTASIGVAIMRPGEHLDLDGLLARVTEALDSARRAGGDRIALDRLHGLARLEDRRRAAQERGTEDLSDGA